MVPDMEPESGSDEAMKLHNAMLEIAKDMKQKEIDLVILTGPHGFVHQVDYFVYFHQVFQGFQILRGANNEQPQARQHIFLGNLQVSQVLIQMLREMKIPASPLIQAETNFPLTLAWGETIPLSYIADENGPEVIIFSTPMAIGLTRGTDEEDAFQELLDIGKVVQTIANSPMLKDRKVAVVISGDLSHKHDENHDYGYHEDSKVFDELAVDWCQSPTMDKIQQLLNLHGNAESCGIYGMTILQSIMANSPHPWQSSQLVYGCPTYFGMAVASWDKVK